MVCLLPVMTAAPLAGQGVRINLQSYTIGMDVPEAPALVALGFAPPVRLGSAPKPVSGSLLFAAGGSATTRAAAIDVSPYYIFFSGIRDLPAYRGNSIKARLTRVFTKTTVSLGAASVSDDPDALSIGLGLRATIHDPHDPVLNHPLPEDVAAAFQQAGVPLPDPEDESVTDRGVDLAPVFARARRAMRARSGDPQVSLGWGMRVRAAGGVQSSDSLGTVGHSGWITAQLATGARYDLIATAEVRDAFMADSRLIGTAAVRRKGVTADYQFGLRYDALNQVLHPALLLDARLATRLGTLVWVDTDAGADRRLRLGLAVRWFSAVDPPMP